jgi:para-nitrobenzyl esterase
MANETIARTQQGRVEGRPRNGVLLFAGIPYAAPPTGPLRFRPPEPPASWSDVRPAKRFGPAAPQRPTGGLTDSAKVRWDEDCLTLNVTTPALDPARRPVLVWIHGGAFRSGQGAIPWYDGSSFAGSGDIVTVSINYRLGALGFSNLRGLGGEDWALSGVCGLLDQVAALEWVRDNIAAFGGDPERVTIAGESAGAMSVGCLLATQRTKGLFHGAIAQSGAAHHAMPNDASLEVAAGLAEELSATCVEDLQAASVDRVLDAQEAVQEKRAKAQLRAGEGISMSFMPTIDGELLDQLPIDAIRAGRSADVPILIGTNRNETTLWGHGKVDEARLKTAAGRYFDDADAGLAAYRALHPDAAPHQLMSALSTDHDFAIPAHRLAEAHAANGGRSHVYLFTWESRAFEGRLGATHALEIPFVFNTLDRPGVDTFLGPVERPQELSDNMHAAWTAFIRDGHPGTDSLPDWPAYSRSERCVMELGDTLRILDDPLATTWPHWDGVR